MLTTQPANASLALASLAATPVDKAAKDEYRWYHNDKHLSDHITKQLQQATRQLDKEADKGFSLNATKPQLPCLAIAEPLKELGIWQYTMAATRSQQERMQEICKSGYVKVMRENKHYRLPFFALLDGYGEQGCADFIAKHLKGCLKDWLELEQRDYSEVYIASMLKCSFVALSQLYPGYDGATLLLAISIGRYLWIVNAGRSRAMLVSPEGSAKMLTVDADPAEECFASGIAKRGGVILNEQINGMLPTVRLIGNRWVTGVTARPKITRLAKEDFVPGSCLVLASDGLYQVAASREVAMALQGIKDFSQKASLLVKAALAHGAQENISVIAIQPAGRYTHK